MVTCGGAGGWKIIEMWQWWEYNKNVMFVVVEGKNRNVLVISERKKKKKCGGGRGGRGKQ